MRTKVHLAAIILIPLLLLCPAGSYATSYWFPWQDLKRVGVTNALHDYWAESNTDALLGIASLGYHAVKFWPTVHYLSMDMHVVYTDPSIDVIALRPLQNATLDTGCNGWSYFRWENIDYGQVAAGLFANYGNLDKLILLTGWENDWQIKGLGCSGTPTQQEISSFVQMLNARQAGIDAARNAYPSALLRIVHAVEINKASSGSGFSVLDDVLPLLTKPPDLISYSAWEASSSNIQNKLSLIRSVSGLHTLQIFIGEYGFNYTATDAATKVYNFGSKALDWGVPFVFYWWYRGDFPGGTHQLINGTWPNITPTQNNVGLTNLRNAYDNF
jgi:hypothetical protein